MDVSIYARFLRQHVPPFPVPRSSRNLTENPVSPDCRGQDFFAIDPDLDDLLRIYLSPEAHRHFGPHFRRLGKLAGGRLDELADRADKRGPVLHVRDRFGRNEDWNAYLTVAGAVEGQSRTPARWLIACRPKS